MNRTSSVNRCTAAAARSLVEGDRQMGFVEPPYLVEDLTSHHQTRAGDRRNLLNRESSATVAWMSPWQPVEEVTGHRIST